MIWDTRCNKRVSTGNHYTPVDTIHSAHINPSVATPKQRKKGLCNTKPSNDSQHSVTAVVFQDEYTLISAGAMDGAIKMWDLRKNYNRVKEPVPKHVFPYAGCSTRKRGFSSLILDSTSSRVFASCTDDIIYQYNCAGISTTPVARYTGHLNNSSFYVKAALSPDDQYLLSGSSDDNAYIWHVGKSEKPLFQLKGHSSEVTSVAWNHQDFTKLVTSSDDNTVKIWRLNRRENSLQGVEKSGWCEKMNTITPSVVDNGAEREPKMSNCVQAVPVINSSTPMQQMVSGPSSPLQGAIVSASQVSSIPKKRATLPLTPPQNDISRKYISPKLKNSSIKKWFNKNTPKRQSPRKSPRKSPVKEKENVCKEVSARGVKRKIENDERFSEDSKRKMTCESTSIDDLKPLDSLEENGVILADHTYMKVTPVKEKRSTIGESEHFTCRSPTVNLPNLILDSPKRDSELLIQANSEKEHKEDKPKVNWLTQIVRQKRLQSGDDDVIQKPGRGTHSDNTGKCPSPKLQKDSITSVGKESSFGRSRPLSPIGRSRPLSPIGRSRPLSPRFTQAPISPKSPKSPNIRHYFQPLLSSTGAK
ncbi:denticleless protein homolog [Glandiceps talaboti]